MNITEHFTLEELIASDTAARAGIDNTLPGSLMPNLLKLANGLELVRKMLIYPIHVTSGYRCARLNQMVGGYKSSDHVLGLAADFICPKFGTPLEICERLALIQPFPFEYNQIIHEFGKWCHISFPAADFGKRELLTIANSTIGYEIGLHKV